MRILYRGLLIKMNKSFILKFRVLIISFLVYFSISFPITSLDFFYLYDYIGLKSFLAITIGLLFGPIGIIGEVLASIFTSMILRIEFQNLIMELILIIIPGITVWLFWNFKTKDPGISFKKPISFFKFIIFTIVIYLFCAYLSNYIVPDDNPKRIFAWCVSLTLLIGIPVIILFMNIFCVKPIMPSKRIIGEKEYFENDIVCVLTKDVKSLSVLNNLLEDYIINKRIDMKRLFEIQNLVEEVYIRIINYFDDIEIEFKSSYDVTFSAEFSYVGLRYNPLKIIKGENDIEVAGIKLIKHRALLASYEYICNENIVHVVI